MVLLLPLLLLLPTWMKVSPLPSTLLVAAVAVVVVVVVIVVLASAGAITSYCTAARRWLRVFSTPPMLLVLVLVLLLGSRMLCRDSRPGRCTGGGRSRYRLELCAGGTVFDGGRAAKPIDVNSCGGGDNQERGKTRGRDENILRSTRTVPPLTTKGATSVCWYWQKAGCLGRAKSRPALA